MSFKKRQVRFQTPEVSELVDLFTELGLPGIKINIDDGESLSLVSVLKEAKFRHKNNDCLISRAVASLIPTLNKKRDDDDNESLWQALLEREIQPQALIMMIYQITENEKSNLSILASTLYFALLQVPGSFIYHVFNSMVFLSCITAVKRWIYTVGDLKPSKRSKARTSEKSSKKEDIDSDNESGVEIESEQIEDDLQHVKPSLVLDCLKCLSSLSHKTCLTTKSDSFMSLVELSIELSRITSIRASKSSHHQQSTPSLHSESDEIVAEVWNFAYSILLGLTEPHHGGDVGMSVVVKALLPNVLMTGFPTVNTSIPKETHHIRKKTLSFLESLVASSRPYTSHNTLQLLLQHICVQIPDKAEYRHAAHSTIADLLSKLCSLTVPGVGIEQQHAPRFLSFLLKYGRHKKAIFRLFAIEVAEELLLNDVFTKPHQLDIPIIQKKSVVNQDNVDDDFDASRQSQTSDHLDDQSAENSANQSSTPTRKLTSQEHTEMLRLLARFIVERSSDKIVNVRSKALSALATTLERALNLSSSKSNSDSMLIDHENGSNDCSNDSFEKAIISVYFGSSLPQTPKAFITSPALGNLMNVTSDMDGTPSINLRETSTPQINAPEFGTPQKLFAPNASDSPSGMKTPGENKSEKIGFSLLSLIKRRLQDERSTVRKSSLHLLEVYCRYHECQVGSDILDLFRSACFDPLLIIRKQASISLTNLVYMFPNCEAILSVWVQSVPVLIFDAEQSVQDSSLKSFVDLVVLRILETFSKNEVQLERDPLAWKLFELITSANNDAHCKTLAKLCSSFVSSLDYLTQTKKFIKAISCVVSMLKSSSATIQPNTLKIANLTKHSLDLACWKALSQFAIYSPKQIDKDLVFGCWEHCKDDTSYPDDCKLKILATLTSIVQELSLETVKQLVDDIESRLKSFMIAPPIIQASVQLLVKLVDRVASSDSTTSKSSNIKWMTSLMAAGDNHLADIIIPSDQGQACKSKFSSMSSLDSVLFTVGEIAQLLPKNQMPSRLVTLLQTFIAPTFKGIVVDPNQPVLTIPAPTRALAFVSLGKLCLQDQQLAKTCIAAFARELEVSPSSIVRNNVMVIMCDLVVRYSNLVDVYLGKLAVCLRDESEMVRRQTLLMLTNLLQEEFIKLRQSNIFFPLILTLVDDSEVLKQFASICLENILSKNGGASQAFFSHFVETIFFLNDYRMHPTYNQFNYSLRERQIFNLAGGGENRAKRFSIYKIFFDHMEDNHKYQISFKLCEEIIQAILDGQLPMEQSQNLLYDTLCILSSHEIRLNHLNPAPASAASKDPEINEQLEEDINNTKAEGTRKLAEITGQLASQVVKRSIIERIVPIIIDLKALLAKHHSPLLKNVMDYLTDLCKEMPDEMAEVLENNKQLASEMDYEMRARGRKNGADLRKRYVDDDEDVVVINKRSKAMPKGAQVGRTLATAASAPTPWKPRASSVSNETTDMADFAVPKLRTGMTPYKPSPARPQAVSNAIPLQLTPQTPKTPRNSSPAPNRVPTTPGGISSPMMNRMRQSAVVINTPSSSSKVAGMEDIDDTFSEGRLNSNSKRARVFDSDGESSPENSMRMHNHSRRAEPETSPTAKPKAKRSKLNEVSSSEILVVQEAPTPTKSRPKRSRE